MAGKNPITVEFQNVDIIFGKEPQKALALLDGGATRDDILAATNNVVGVAGASLAIEEGEICVLMGLSGSGKSTLLRAVNGLNRSEEHTSELQSLMRISYAVFCLNKKTK